MPQPCYCGIQSCEAVALGSGFGQVWVRQRTQTCTISMSCTEGASILPNSPRPTLPPNPPAPFSSSFS